MNKKHLGKTTVGVLILGGDNFIRPDNCIVIGDGIEVEKGEDYTFYASKSFRAKMRPWQHRQLSKLLASLPWERNPTIKE